MLPDNLLERIPPNAIETEQALLGACLLEIEAIEKAVEIMRPEYFYRETHKIIYEAIVALYDKKDPVDLITLGEYLKGKAANPRDLESGTQLEMVGGTLYLMTIMNACPTAGGVKHYSEIIKAKYSLRELIKNADRVMMACYSVDATAEEIVRVSQAELDRIMTASSPAESTLPMAHYAAEVLDKLDDQVMNGTPPGIMTGLGYLDHLTLGWQNSDMILIGALSNVGKSQFALNNIALPAARAGYKVQIQSSEMGERSIARRALIAMATTLENKHMRDTRFRDANWDELKDNARDLDRPMRDQLVYAIDELKGLPLYVGRPKLLTPNKVLQLARKQKNEVGLDLLVIDYFQLMCADNPTSNARLDFANISHRLKDIAVELDIPVVIVTSLNRAADGRSNKDPIYSDIGETNALFYDSDLTMFLHRPWIYNKQEDLHLCDLIIAKQRNGPPGRVPLWFADEKNTFMARDDRM